MRAPAGPDSAAQVLDERIKNILRDLDHLGRSLVGLLVLQEARCLFVQIDAGHTSAIALDISGNRRRYFCSIVRTLGADTNLGNKAGKSVGECSTINFALMGSAKGNGNFFREFDKVIKTVS